MLVYIPVQLSITQYSCLAASASQATWSTVKPRLIAIKVFNYLHCSSVVVAVKRTHLRSIFCENFFASCGVRLGVCDPRKFVFVLRHAHGATQNYSARTSDKLSLGLTLGCP